MSEELTRADLVRIGHRAHDVIEALREQIDRLTRERDEARAACFDCGMNLAHHDHKAGCSYVTLQAEIKRLEGHVEGLLETAKLERSNWGRAYDKVVADARDAIADRDAAREIARLTRERDEARAERDTARECHAAAESSRENLARYAADDFYWSLPMSGPDIITRNAIKEARADRDAARAELAEDITPDEVCSAIAVAPPVHDITAERITFAYHGSTYNNCLDALSRGIAASINRRRAAKAKAAAEAAKGGGDA